MYRKKSSQYSQLIVEEMSEVKEYILKAAVEITKEMILYIIRSLFIYNLSRMI